MSIFDRVSVNDRRKRIRYYTFSSCYKYVRRTMLNGKIDQRELPKTF